MLGAFIVRAGRLREANLGLPSPVNDQLIDATGIKLFSVFNWNRAGAHIHEETDIGSGNDDALYEPQSSPGAATRSPLVHFILLG